MEVQKYLWGDFMAKTSMIRARVDENLKKNAQELFTKLGITMSDAITMFLQQCELNNGIPFKLEIPNDETKRVIDDARNGIGVNRCDSMEQLFKELKED
jgi:DNA-damage-inducible protein J